MFIVDTNIVSDLRKSDKAPPSLVAWAKSQPPSAIYISAVSMWELEYGILLKAYKDPLQGEVLKAWFEQIVIPAYAGRILPVCFDVTRACAPLHVPDKRPERDALIAATAIVHKMTVVTRNEKDFAGMNCPLLNPWKAA
jgi:predicted nucleic acid-binding protein